MVVLIAPRSSRMCNFPNLTSRGLANLQCMGLYQVSANKRREIRKRGVAGVILIFSSLEQYVRRRRMTQNRCQQICLLHGEVSL